MQGVGGGAPPKLTPERAAIVIANVRTNLSITNAARIARLSPQTPLNWIKRGESDRAKKKDTIYTKFLDNIREAQGLKIRELMEKVELMPKGWQAVAWLLEKCCAEDFGKDSELYKQLLEDYRMLMQALVDRQGAQYSNKPIESKAASIDGESNG